MKLSKLIKIYKNIQNSMKRLTVLLGCVAFGITSVMAQGANNIKINEVMVNNYTSIQDEYGVHGAWVELVNTAYSSYNVRGMYITTNREVLRPDMKADERMKLMSMISNDEPRTALKARQHLVLFLNSNTSKGGLHLAEKLDSTSTWIALYDGNAVDLIDSISLPAVAEYDCSYARVKDGADEWTVKAINDVTPGIANVNEASVSKVEKLKKNDPHGFGITLLSMGIVFSCLALLWVFFTLTGKYFKKQDEKKTCAAKANFVDNAAVEPKAAVAEVKSKPAKAGKADDALMAVIGLALYDYLGGVHDKESGIITIKPRQSTWTGVGQATPIPTVKK